MSADQAAPVVDPHRVAVVTGGAGAIGGAIVARLASGHRVVVLDRTGKVPVDLSDQDDVRRAAAVVLERYGRCDVLVHAAAMVGIEPLDSVGLELWRRVQAVNVESAVLLTQAFTPGMRERRFGRVILIVSNTFWRPPRICSAIPLRSASSRRSSFKSCTWI